MKKYVVEIRCSKCEAANSITLKTKNKLWKCKICNQIMFSSKCIKGYVYILSNPSIFGLIKIGFTERENVVERIKELNSASGVPEPFSLEATFNSSRPKDSEKLIHKKLEKFRYSRQREFFKIPLKDAINTIMKLLNSNPFYIKDEKMLLTKEETAEREILQQEETIKKKNNNIEKLYKSGLNYYFGKGVETDYRKSAELLKEAAIEGHAEAQYFLGNAYSNGEVFLQNFEDAYYWLKISAEEGYKKSQELLKKKEILFEHVRLAEEGVPESQFWLANAYRETNMNSLQEKEHYWMKKAAMQDHVGALEHVDVDNYELNWLVSAAENGEINSQFHLGLMYFFGKGTNEDRDMANFWLERASNSGNREAEKFLKKIKVIKNPDISKDIFESLEKEYEQKINQFIENNELEDQWTW